MKYFIVSTGLFVIASILYSAAYITSAILHTISNSFGGNILLSQTQPLSIFGLIALLGAILFLFIGLFKKDPTNKTVL